MLLYRLITHVVVVVVVVAEGSTESLGSTTGSFRNTLLETTDVDYRRVCNSSCY